MRKLKDLKCNRCGCTASLQGIDGEDLKDKEPN